ncbi:MAG TPA: ParA family protein [Steroidobacteraceae bacterium]|nr:ParA family protein [Steroidobacteraceae bacterium]
MHRIVILNPKGGSGKSTITTNLASFFAARDMKPTVMDLDPQGSSIRWVNKRDPGIATVHGIAGFEKKAGVTRSFALRIPQDSQVVIVDTPAALDAQRLPEVTRDANTILVPVLPSDIDIHAATRCIADLLLIAKIKREEQRVAVIANRVKRNTVMYRSLMKFLHTLQIPVIATLRDSQAYVRCFEQGVGIFEVKPYSVREDIEQWQPLIGWLTQRDNVGVPTSPMPTAAVAERPATPAATVSAPAAAVVAPAVTISPAPTTSPPNVASLINTPPAPVATPPVAPSVSLEKLYSLSSKGSSSHSASQPQDKTRSAQLPYWFLQK